MNFLRTIRMDASDCEVFPLAASAGEWAVPGTFAFSNVEPDSIAGKQRQAFANGWLGVESFGRSTFVQVVSIEEEELDDVVQRLAVHFVAEYGAPDIAAAIPVAQEETRYAIDLCNRDAGTLLAIERSFAEDGVREKIRAIENAAGQSHD